MRFADLYNETVLAVKSNKARSALTILGIVIGIGSVIAMISVGQGSQKSIESSIQSIGSNLIMIMPGSQRTMGAGPSSGRGSAQTLTLGDAEAIKSSVSGINNVAADSSRRYQVAAKSSNTNTQIIGTDASYSEVRNVAVETGSFISEQNTKNLSKVAVLGPSTRDDLFGENATNAIGQTIKINNIDFKVIGVTKSRGGTGFSNQDDMIYVPLTTAQRYLFGDTYISTISIQTENADYIDQVQSQISSLLLSRHKIADASQADFQIMNQADIVSTASSVTGTFTTLLAAIAGISLIVGGIGIMNMMLTTVTERTREIGLRKAIGARKNDISRQFLAEALMLTFLGGVIGILVGWIAALAISSFAQITTSVSGSSVALAFGVSAAIGIIFGYYPATRAAKLNPIEALRYE
ncbi:MAG: ABC transporter permease [Patescibacteria group bacterium]|nr:ABC transporter permease [Patescibacteria group bacterium]